VLFRSETDARAKWQLDHFLAETRRGQKSDRRDPKKKALNVRMRGMFHVLPEVCIDQAQKTRAPASSRMLF